MSETRKLCTERLVLALDQELRRRGRGSIGDLEDKLGMSHSWWYDRKRAQDLTLRQFSRTLQHLGLDPWIFLRKHVEEDDLWGFDRPQGEAPAVVQRALERVGSHEEPLADLGYRYLDTLDEQRYDQPERVAEHVNDIVNAVELANLPRLLGILGSALRLLRRFDEAAHAFYAAIEIARARGDRRTAGNLLRRATYVIGDQGDRLAALQLAERAMILLLREGDALGVAKAQVEQGIWLFYLDRWQECVGCLELTLPDLPEEAFRYRYSALQCMALAYRSLGDLDRCMERIQLAEQWADQVGKRHRAKLDWLRSELLIEFEEYGPAEATLWTVVETMRECHFVEAALATCDLVKVQLLAQKPEDAFLTSLSMRALIIPAQNDPIVESAIAELLRAGRQGLTLTLVEHIKTRIERERQESPSWSSSRSRV